MTVINLVWLIKKSPILPSRGHCAAQQIVSANHGSLRSRTAKLLNIVVDFASCYCISHENSAKMCPSLKAGGNPMTMTMTHSRLKHCMEHEQHVAEITQNYITWPRGWPLSSWVISLADVKGWVFQRDVSEVVKVGTDVISDSDPWCARIEFMKPFHM